MAVWVPGPAVVAGDDLESHDDDGPHLGSLFAGYEGLGMATSAALGTTTTWYSEIEPGAKAVLAHHYPLVPNLGDITAVDWAAMAQAGVRELSDEQFDSLMAMAALNIALAQLASYFEITRAHAWAILERAGALRERASVIDDFSLVGVDKAQRPYRVLDLALDQGALAAPTRCQRCSGAEPARAWIARADSPLQATWLCPPCYETTATTATVPVAGGGLGGELSDIDVMTGGFPCRRPGRESCR